MTKAELHRRISYYKSGLRILGCVLAVSPDGLLLLAVFLGVAELLGIAEEVWGA